MCGFLNLFDVNNVVKNSSIYSSEGKYTSILISYLNAMKKNVRVNVENAADATRKALESYLHAKFPSLKDKSVSFIIENKKNELSDVEYNSLESLRLFGNTASHVELCMKYDTKITQKIVFKIFALFLATISNDYLKYFDNINDIVTDYNFSDYTTSTNEQYRWLYDIFVNKLSMIREVSYCLYDFPIGDYEIIKKYSAGDVYFKKLNFERYVYIVKEKDEDVYYYVEPSIKTKQEGKREKNFDNIARNKGSISDLMIKASSIKFERFKAATISETSSPHMRAYDLYSIKKNTVRLDDYLLSHKNLMNKYGSLLIIKKITDILVKYQNTFHHRSLNEKSIFVTDTNDNFDINIGSFKYVKIKDKWEEEINSETVGPSQRDKSKKNTDYFSAISVNNNLLEDTDNADSPEKMDVYSLIVLLAYIIDMDTGINKPITSNCFSNFSDSNIYKNSLLKSIKADYFDEIMSLDDFKNFIDEEIKNNANS